MDFIAAEPFELVCVERLAERVRAAQWTIGELFPAVFKPRQHLVLKETTQAFRVGRGRLLVLFKLVRTASEHILPPALGILAQSRESHFVGVIALGPEQ